MKNVSISLFLIEILFLSSCSIKYQLPDTILTAKQICGSPKCQPGNTGLIFNFTKNPYSPGIKEKATSKDIAYSVIGHTVISGDLSGSLPNICSYSSNNPFTINDVEPIRWADGREIDYKRTETLNINIDAAINANLIELAKLNLTATQIQNASAKIKAVYNRINGQQLTVVGKYSEWGLSADALQKITHGDGYRECRDYIESNNYRIITAVGLVYFDILFNSNSIDSLASALDAALSASGITASLSVSFKRTVSESLNTTNHNVFQILLWRHAALKNGNLTAEINKISPFAKTCYFHNNLNIDKDFIIKKSDYDRIVFDSTEISINDPTYDHRPITVSIECKEICIKGRLSVHGKGADCTQKNPTNGKPCNSCGNGSDDARRWPCGSSDCSTNHFDPTHPDDLGHKGPKGFAGDNGPVCSIKCDNIIGDLTFEGCADKYMLGGGGGEPGNPGPSRICHCHGHDEAFAGNEGTEGRGDPGAIGKFIFLVNGQPFNMSTVQNSNH